LGFPEEIVRRCGLFLDLLLRACVNVHVLVRDGVLPSVFDWLDVFQDWLFAMLRLRQRLWYVVQA